MDCVFSFRAASTRKMLTCPEEATNVTTGPEHLSYGHRLRELGLLSWEKASVTPCRLFQYLKGAHKKVEEGLFTWAGSDRTKGNGFKLTEDRFRLDIKKFSAVRVVRH